MTTQEIQDEIDYLEQKRIDHGWTQADVLKYNHLISLQ